MERYTINVHYDYYTQVVVEAETNDEAMEKAVEIADGIPSSELQYCDYTDAYVTDIQDIQ